MSGAGAPADADLALARSAAAAAGVVQNVHSATPLGDGAKSRVLRLDFADREALALKIYSSDVAANEQAGLRLAAGAGLPLPELIGSGAPGPDSPHGWTLMTLAPGRPMNEFTAELSLGEELALQRQVGALLRRLHTLSGEGFGRPADDELAPSNLDHVLARFARALRHFERLGGSADLADRVWGLLRERAALFDQCSEPVFCHGDLHAENVRVVEGARGLEVVGALDLESCFLGDPALDLALTWAARSPHDDDVWWALLEGYGDPPLWLDSLLDVYVVLAELELWIWFAEGGAREPLASIAARIALAVGSG